MQYSDDELELIGIKRTQAVGRGKERTNAYIYKCASCGINVQRLSVMLDKPVYCSLCKNNALRRMKAAEQEAERQKIYLSSLDIGDANKKLRFQKAALMMRKLGGYDSAIRKAELAYDKYGSTPEAIAAIVLLKCGYRVITQQHVSDYTCDFVLPDEKIVIEVDGSIFHADEAKQEIRDMSIKYNLGNEWEILHIPADSLSKKPKAFESLIKQKIAVKRFIA